jgi:hypothetical protein
MRIFSRLFSTQKLPSVSPEIQFGRFSDAEKSAINYQHWDRAVDAFENEKYIQSYIDFLSFLKNDFRQNIVYSVHQGILKFELFQGSKIVAGEANHNKFRAIAKIVKAPNPSLPLMRSLLETNYALKYTKYVIDEDQNISLIFDTFVEDSSPHKLYQALKELATEADRRDDVLIKKFDNLEAINVSHLRQISDHEKRTKYEFLKEQIQLTLSHVHTGSLKSQEYPGAISFLLLDLMYKIDFLIKPECHIKEKITECHSLFFEDSISSVHDKNRSIIEIINEIDQFSYDTITQEFYDVNSTFGISKPEGNNVLQAIIEAQQKDLNWYINNHPNPYASAICGYTIGYSLYSFAMPEPLRETLVIFYKSIYCEYYAKLGFSPTHSFGNKDFANYLKKSLKNVMAENDNFKLDVSKLKFDDMAIFCASYIDMLRTIKY